MHACEENKGWAQHIVELEYGKPHRAFSCYKCVGRRRRSQRDVLQSQIVGRCIILLLLHWCVVVANIRGLIEMAELRMNLRWSLDWLRLSVSSHFAPYGSNSSMGSLVVT